VILERVLLIGTHLWSTGLVKDAIIKLEASADDDSVIFEGFDVDRMLGQSEVDVHTDLLSLPVDLLPVADQDGALRLQLVVLGNLRVQSPQISHVVSVVGQPKELGREQVELGSILQEIGSHFKTLIPVPMMITLLLMNLLGS